MADFEVTFVDVGHGDATLIKIPGDQYVLVDVYRCPGEGIDVFKLLDDVLPDGDDGRKRLDVLAITHAHDDHIAGIGDLYAASSSTSTSWACSSRRRRWSSARSIGVGIFTATSSRRRRRCGPL
jgi:glyoxylase-like metal-dependent hydrolase (beta-lactamase superfamily II)